MPKKKQSHHTPPIREIRVAIRQSLSSGCPKIASVAEQVGITQRTLQRRLSMIGTTYTTLVSELRLDLAEKLLRDKARKISKNAYIALSMWV